MVQACWHQLLSSIKGKQQALQNVVPVCQPLDINTETIENVYVSKAKVKKELVELI